MFDSKMNDTSHLYTNEDSVDSEDNLPERDYLSFEDYDCIGFDLDHTLCRYNIGPMIRLEYELLANFLVEKRGYDPSLKQKIFDVDADFVCKGLTLDIDRGNLLRLGKDGVILAASHGTRKMSDIEIEKVYGRGRKKHIAFDYATHLNKHGPLEMGEFGIVLHSFMDYFDYPTILICARIVDVLDQLNNHGKALEDYNFWPDVLDGLKEMFTRTQFAVDQGGYFPRIKANPEKYIMKRSAQFRDWLKMLRANGKFLYVITGSHVDFASHVASYALGPDWMDLFDIVIFFARKPSFFIDRRPFWKLDGVEEVNPFTGWDALDTNHFYSQGNWHDLNEFFEYVTEWEPSASLYFGDNILQDILAPNKFTKNCDSVAVSEEMIAEGMVGLPASHPHANDLVSSIWGSYFYYPEPVKKNASVLSRASSFAKRKQSIGDANAGRATPNATISEMKKVINIRRVSSFKESDIALSRPPSVMNRLPGLQGGKSRGSSPINIKVKTGEESPDQDLSSPATRSTPVENSGCSSGRETPCDQEEVLPLKGQAKINTLWGNCIKNYAKMCIPDLEVLVNYPIDYKYPKFCKNSRGEVTSSGFFPADPISLHIPSTTAHK